MVSGFMLPICYKLFEMCCLTRQIKEIPPKVGEIQASGQNRSKASSETESKAKIFCCIVFVTLVRSGLHQALYLSTIDK